MRACSILAQIILKRGHSRNFKAIWSNSEVEWVPETHLLAPVGPYRGWAPCDSPQWEMATCTGPTCGSRVGRGHRDTQSQTRPQDLCLPQRSRPPGQHLLPFFFLAEQCFLSWGTTIHAVKENAFVTRNFLLQTFILYFQAQFPFLLSPGISLIFCYFLSFISPVFISPIERVKQKGGHGKKKKTIWIGLFILLGDSCGI